MSSFLVAGGGRPTSHPHHSMSPIIIHNAVKGILSFPRIVSSQDCCEGSVSQFPQNFWGPQAAPHPAVCLVCSMWTAQQGGCGGTRIWLAVRAAGTDADAAIYTVSTFGRTKSGRLPTNLRNQAVALHSSSANWRTEADRVPLCRLEHLNSDGVLSQSLCSGA